jgi:hypothetical protein
MERRSSRPRRGSQNPLLRLPAVGDNAEMKTQGEIEAAVCNGIRQFEQDCPGSA